MILNVRDVSFSADSLSLVKEFILWCFVDEESLLNLPGFDLSESTLDLSPEIFSDHRSVQIGFHTTTMATLGRDLITQICFPNDVQSHLSAT
jgi:hypothetical protein